MVARAACHQLAAEARILIHLEHVDAHVRYAGGDYLLERVAPAFRSLVWQSGDEVDAEVGDPRTTQVLNIGERDRARVQAADRAALLIDKRLHPKADAVYPAAHKGVHDFGSQCARCAFDRDFCIRRDGEPPPHFGEEELQLVGSEYTRRSSSQVDRIDLAVDLGARLRRQSLSALNFRSHRVDITIEQLAREDARGEVAERALERQKGTEM